MVTQFHLTGEEQLLAENPEIFYAKHHIIDKVYQLMGALSSDYSRLSVRFPEEVLVNTPKIYKGENYRLLPYVMLDQPRYFKTGSEFAIRSLFWWGQHFSIHLLLGRTYKELFQERILQAVAEGELSGWHISLTNEPWQHHFEKDNYLPVQTFSLPAADLSKSYLKLGTLLPLRQWSQADQFFEAAFTRLVTIMGLLPEHYSGAQPNLQK